MKIVMPVVVVGSLLVALAPAASAAGVCSEGTPQYCPAPVVSTGPAINVGTDSATLTGTVNPNGAFTTCGFLYGLTSPSGMQTPAQTVAAGASPVAVTATLVGLQAQTTVQFALVCVSAGGVATGSTVTFTTLDHGPSHLALIGRKAFVSSSRRVRVYLACFGDRSCSGTVTITRNGSTVGSTSYFLSSNSGAAVTMKLRKSTFRKLKHHSLRAQVTATQTDAGNTASGSIRLHRFT